MNTTPSGFSITMAKETFIDFFTNNRSLAGTISKWIASNTANNLVKNSPIMPLTNTDNANNFATGNN